MTPSASSRPRRERPKTETTAEHGLDNETYALMKGLIGMRATCTVMDLASREARASW